MFNSQIFLLYFIFKTTFFNFVSIKKKKIARKRKRLQQNFDPLIIRVLTRIAGKSIFPIFRFSSVSSRIIQDITIRFNITKHGPETSLNRRLGLGTAFKSSFYFSLLIFFSSSTIRVHTSRTPRTGYGDDVKRRTREHYQRLRSVIAQNNNLIMIMFTCPKRPSTGYFVRILFSKHLSHMKTLLFSVM